jgi:hypothetical protein
MLGGSKERSGGDLDLALVVSILLCITSTGAGPSSDGRREREDELHEALEVNLRASAKCILREVYF